MSARRGEYSEIEELNRILTVERELVLKTQDNYRILKEKYLEVSRENELLRKEHEKVKEGAESREKLMELEARSDELIKSMRQANEEREVRYEKFKVDTIEELQNVYRKELQDQNSQIEKLRFDRMELVKENDQLLEEIANFNVKIDDLKRKEKAKEVEMTIKFDKKLKEIVMDNEKKVSPRLESFEKTIESLHEEIQRKEEAILEKSRQFSADISEKNSEIESLKSSKNKLEIEIQGLESTVQSLNVKLLKSRETDSSSGEISDLKSRNEILLRERMELELRMRQEQRESARNFGDFEEKLSVRISEFEKLCEQKDAQIEELQSQIEKKGKIEEELDKSERNRQIEEDHRERLELEVKSLYGKLQKSGEEREASESSLKVERDRLEISLLTLKKQLESTPEAPQNVEKLRKELRESEKKRRSEKEKLQNVISEFSSALKRIEKQHLITQDKMREQMASFHL